jgi:type IV pilus assembly protein PilX
MRSLPEHDSPVIAHHRAHAAKQRGVVLFFALIALVVMSLAAVALIRSVDTSTMIAGNLAFKQAATASSDRGVESAITMLTNIETAMKAAGKSVYADNTNTFNVTVAANGYYSNADPALNLTSSATWVNASSFPIPDDGSGYAVRYIVQRMCRGPNQVLSKSNCLFSSPSVDNNGHNIPLPSDVCQGAGCPVAGQSPQYRITSRTAGPGNTVSYIQAFVY